MRALCQQMPSVSNVLLKKKVGQRKGEFCCNLLSFVSLSPQKADQAHLDVQMFPDAIHILQAIP